MANLPLANIFNRKTRTTVGILAVAIGVGLVVDMVGLAHGSLDETADRIKNVGADIIFQSPDSSPFLAINSGVMSERISALLLTEPGVLSSRAGPRTSLLARVRALRPIVSPRPFGFRGRGVSRSSDTSRNVPAALRALYDGKIPLQLDGRPTNRAIPAKPPRDVTREAKSSEEVGRSEQKHARPFVGR